MIDLKRTLLKIKGIANNADNWKTHTPEQIVTIITETIDDALLHYPEVPPELVALSSEATPGDWFWDHGSTLRTTYNPIQEYSRFYQYILWPQNVPGGEDLTAAEQMGACGTDTEPQAEANQQLLVASVNYVRQLVKDNK